MHWEHTQGEEKHHRDSVTLENNTKTLSNAITGGRKEGSGPMCVYINPVKAIDQLQNSKLVKGGQRWVIPASHQDGHED